MSEPSCSILELVPLDISTITLGCNHCSDPSVTRIDPYPNTVQCRGTNRIARTVAKIFLKFLTFALHKRSFSESQPSVSDLQNVAVWLGYFSVLFLPDSVGCRHHTEVLHGQCFLSIVLMHCAPSSVCMCVCVIYICLLCASECVMPVEARRGHRMPRSWSCRQL